MPEDRKEILGRGGVVINLLGIALVVMSLAFTFLMASSRFNDLPTAIGNALLFGLLASFGYLIATTSVKILGDELVLVRLLAVTSLALSAVEQVTGDNGLAIKTTSGETLTHIGYGSSVLGALTGNRRANRVARRVRASIDAHELGGRPELGTRHRARPGLGLVVALPLLYAALVAIIHS